MKEEIAYLHLITFGGFRPGRARYGFNVVFNLSNSVNYIFSNSATRRLMYFGTLPKSLKRKQQVYSRSTLFGSKRLADKRDLSELFGVGEIINYYFRT